MDKIGPKEAGDTIRADFQNEPADPRFLHQVRFAKDVLTELGKDQSVENVAKAMRLLDRAGIEGHAYNDYPKWVQNERGERAVVNDEEHEEAFMSRPVPADDDGVPNPAHGHVDPQSGVFVEGNEVRRPEPYGGIAPPYEPGAVPVIEHGGQKGPVASPVSDNRVTVQQNLDPMRGQREAAADEPVKKAHYGEVVTEPASDHANTVQPSGKANPPQPADVDAVG